MADVKNKAPIRRLTMRYIKAGRGMHAVVITAVMLTAILFTALFGIGISLMKNFENQTARQVGTASMAGVKYILPEDAERIAADPKIKNIGIRRFLGTGMDEQFKKYSVEFSSMNDQGARNAFSYPETGSMPAAYDEIALPDVLLYELDAAQRIGERVILDIDVDGRILKDQQFTVCGIWRGDELSHAQMVWVSKEYCNENAPTPTVDYDHNTGNYAGYINIDFDFNSSFNIEKQTDDLLIRRGYDPEDMHIGINWAYGNASAPDLQTVCGGAALLLIIAAAGYLIIYNVFLINVTANIRQFGLLKTIGITSRQIKKMLRMQALVYWAEGTVPGLILGTGAAYLLLPVIADNFGGGSGFKMFYSPLIYILAAVFNLVTVFISCIKPAKSAGKVSPTEALRISDADERKKKGKRSHSVRASSMAFANVMRGKKKLAATVLSMSLSIMLFYAVSSLIQGFDTDKYVASYVTGDFRISGAAMAKTGTPDVFDANAVSDEDIEFINSVEGVKSARRVYSSVNALPKEGEFGEKINSMTEMGRESIEKRIPEFAEEYIAQFKAADEFYCDLYGIDRELYDNISIIEGKSDKEKFMSGDYVIASFGVVGYDGMQDSAVQIGDKIPVTFEDGSRREYEVMAIGIMPANLTPEVYDLIYGSLILPSEEFRKHAVKQGCAFVSVEAEEGMEDNVRSALDSYIAGQNDSIGYMSKQDYIDEYEGFNSMFRIVGGTLSGALALIGILNFINSCSTRIYSGKHEFAIMQAVGMTGRQLKGMLIFEGLYYAVFTSVVSVVSSVVMTPLILNSLFGDSYFTIKANFSSFAVSLPILFVFACLIPGIAYKNICKASMIDRLRECC